MLPRDEALELVKSQNPEPHLVNHAIQTEAIMRALALKLGHDPELWGVTGLLHDLDYPQTKDNPARHGLDAADMLKGKMPEDALQAIVAHNEEHTQVAAANQFDYALRAAESATGLISAAALVRPTRMEGMKPKSLKKKMKDKSFAASVSRERIRECEKLDMDLGEFFLTAIPAMAEVASETGLG
ncbi:HDIG domain-containing metalloprotein [Desulfovibrio ferrophilus]|uniref:Metal dependent phosphohydrolase n=1 Tax=Desulfovibrio ferrophilus TaxID=241368 RepID=A0A2Z6B3F3_9BACT|nr:HDIG domain-containing metalloprotein [Desulfovibrio ferrophilus]BBD10064.1 metal dependent phosphohydrolase [Desulfovibrio ferrophilus]